MSSKEKGNLKAVYEQIYTNGKEKFFSFDSSDVTQEVVKEMNWNDLEVLEIGCGTGETAFAVARAGASYVKAVDFAESAIRIAHNRYDIDNLFFEVGSSETVAGVFDCIVMQDVIEHTDDPLGTIKSLQPHLKQNGHLIITCPSFINLRGTVWMTLQILFDVPMSLTDKHFIIPNDMVDWGRQTNMRVTWRTFRYEQAHGHAMIQDMKKRLKNALRDANMDNSNVERLLDWLTKASEYQPNDAYNGAKALYHFRNNNSCSTL